MRIGLNFMRVGVWRRLWMTLKASFFNKFLFHEHTIQKSIEFAAISTPLFFAIQWKDLSLNTGMSKEEQIG
jgi:hypothetical protein